MTPEEISRIASEYPDLFEFFVEETWRRRVVMSYGDGLPRLLDQRFDRSIEEEAALLTQGSIVLEGAANLSEIARATRWERLHDTPQLVRLRVVDLLATESIAEQGLVLLGRYEMMALGAAIRRCGTLQRPRWSEVMLCWETTEANAMIDKGPQAILRKADLDPLVRAIDVSLDEAI